MTHTQKKKRPSIARNYEKFDGKWTVRFGVVRHSIQRMHIEHDKFNLTKFNQKLCVFLSIFFFSRQKQKKKRFFFFQANRNERYVISTDIVRDLHQCMYRYATKCPSNARLQWQTISYRLYSLRFKKYMINRTNISKSISGTARMLNVLRAQCSCSLRLPYFLHRHRLFSSYSGSLLRMR